MFLSAYDRIDRVLPRQEGALDKISLLNKHIPTQF